MAYGIYYMWYIIALHWGGRVGWWLDRVSLSRRSWAQVRPAQVFLSKHHSFKWLTLNFDLFFYSVVVRQ